MKFLIFALTLLGAAAAGAESKSLAQQYAENPYIVDRDMAVGFTKRALSGGLHADELDLALTTLAELPHAPFSKDELTQLRQKAAFAKLSDNEAAALCVGFFTGVYSPSFLGALFPNPLNTFFDVAAYASNVALKFCPPVMSAPADITVRPNRAPDSNGNQCEYHFTQERTKGSFESILGIPAVPVGSNWPGSAADDDSRGFGTPQEVFHFNSDVDLRLLLPGSADPGTDGDKLIDDLSSALLPAALSPTLAAAAIIASQIDWGVSDGCNSEGSAEFDDLGLPCPFVKDRQIPLRVGTHTATWRGDTMFQLLDLVYIYVPGLPSGTKWKKAKEFLINVLVEALSIGAGEVTKKYALGIQSLRTQTIRVLDEVAPVLQPSLFPLAQTQPYLVEANSPGGEYSRNHIVPLHESFVVQENCDNPVRFPFPPSQFFWPLNTDRDNPNPDPQDDIFLTFEASDYGPATDSGGVNTDSDEVWIRVVDTRPPEVIAPPDIVLLASTGPVAIDPGVAQVFDVADLEPQVEVSINGGEFSSTVPTSFDVGQTRLVWRAVDSSGNISDPLEPRAEQLINIKPSNVEPVAAAQTGSNAPTAVSFEPLDIVLTGSDDDFDPLAFHIRRQPERGFFISPLLPYFVSDFRLEAQLTVDEMIAGCNETPPVEPPVNLISDAEFFASDDDGNTYVIDRGWFCVNRDNGLGSDRRIAKFDRDGEVIGQQFNSAASLTGVKRLFIEPDGRVSYVSSANSLNDHAIVILDQQLNRIERYSLNNVAPTYADGAYDPDLCENPDANMSPIDEIDAGAVDPQGIVYSADARGRLLAYDSQNLGSGDEAAYLGSLTGCGDLFFREVADIALDSEANVYASDKTNDRIYKFTASYFDADGTFVPGRFVGWLGKCTQDTAPGDEAVCIFDNAADPSDGHSLGFSCTDEVCGPARPGDRPGQFDQPQGIDIDPRDVLYVLDKSNRRVQRFTSDGLFAGQAQSNCDASRCFAIGDFGLAPEDVTVNSDNFYVLDTETDILHIFVTTVVEPIDDNSAKVVYQTDGNYDNSSDFFTFSATDGLMVDGEFVMSDEARVDLNLVRNMRAPVATPFIDGSTDEDESIQILLDGSDPDAPLDVLNFGIATSPANGMVSVAGNVATYTPDDNFFGMDAFEFYATDGAQMSAPELVTIDIAPVNDAPTVSLDNLVDVGRGYEAEFAAAFNDPDPQDTHLIFVDWGDGQTEPEGEQLEDGTITGPLLDQTPAGNGELRARHTYLSNGDYAVSLCATDQVEFVNDVKVPTAQSLTTCGLTTARVVDMADLALYVSDLETTTAGGSEFFRINIDYVGPEAGSGPTATSVEVALSVDRGANIVVMDPVNGSCQIAGRTGTCSLNNMAPDTSTHIDVGLGYDPVVGPGSVLDLEVSVSSALPDPNGGRENYASISFVRQADFLVTASSANSDLPDADPGDGVCATSESVCTLRAAVQESAAAGKPRTIALGSGTFLLNREATAKSRKVEGENHANQGDLDIRSSITITGLGAQETIIDGFGEDRLFDIYTGDVVVESVTLTGGAVGQADSTDTDPWAGLGGAIILRDDANLTLRDVVILGNVASLGGGIAHIGTGELSVVRSAIHANQASNSGGGVVNSGPMTLRNVTLSGNKADGRGGALQHVILNASPTTELIHVTVAGNQAGIEAGGIIDSAGGGVTVTNSILADNSAASGSNCVGSLQSRGGSLLSDSGTSGDGAATCFLTGGSDQINVPAGINELREFVVGQTPVHSLRSDSPAINRANQQQCLPIDQVGIARPDPAGGTGCDSGAAEFTDLFFSGGFELQN